MAGFTFELESLLKIKEKLEDRAKTEYGKSISKLEKEKETLKFLERKKGQTISEFRLCIEKGINPYQIEMMNKFITFIDQDILQQKKNVERSYIFFEEKRQELINAMKERKIFETLKEKEKESYIKQIFQKEQKIIDEIISYKYNKG